MQEPSPQVARAAPRRVPADIRSQPALESRLLGPSGSARYRLGALSAACEGMGQVFALLDRIKATDLTVTLVGETGTGKDVLANALHATGPRSSGPFVVFDCGSVSANLAESELFGHERGSFTGAVSSYTGAFERAHGGTLFLDEIGELPLELQPRLLRVLENRKVRRVGGAQDRSFDVRIVAATNRDLPAEVSAGRFRQDLFFRLAGAIVPVPPLRARLDDLPLLVESILEDLQRSDTLVTPAVLDALAERQWPGNVRELKNTLVRALAFLEEGSPLDLRHLRELSTPPPPPAAAPPAPASDSSPLELLPLGRQNLQDIERVAIKQTLMQTGGNKSLAARELGIAVSTLYEKLKRHGL